MANNIILQISKLFKVDKLFKAVIFCLMACSLLACTNYMNVRPENQILLEEYWKKGSDVEASVLACYRAMQEDDYMYRVICWGELRSDNVIPAPSANDNSVRDASSANILPTNSLTQWGSFYTVINYCNTVLKFAPQVVDIDPNFTNADLQAKSAEVLAIRALCYFYLVRTFRDVPLVLEPTVDDTQVLQVPQSPPADVLTQITNDLLQAEQWALSEYSTTVQTKGRMTKDAIRAILADVYLWQGKYTECVDYCDKLINAVATTTSTGMGTSTGGPNVTLPKYPLIQETTTGNMPFFFIFYPGWYGNSSESIFELQFTTEKYNEGVGKLYGKTNEGNDKIQLNATTMYAEGNIVFPLTDERKFESLYVTQSEGGTYPIIKFWYYPIQVGTNSYSYSSSSTTPNWIFYRITDIMLMKAEALVQLDRSENDLRDALHIVNTTYMRSNPTLLETDSLTFQNYSDPTTLDYLVLLERQRELMFEGKRWFDLVRRSERKGSSQDLVTFVSYKYTDNVSTIAAKLSVMNALYMPINADELKANPLLVQNPYYITSTNIVK